MGWLGKVRSRVGLGRLPRLRRARTLWGYQRKRLETGLRWVFAGPEDSNFTYELTELNVEHLVRFVSVVTDTPVDQIRGYVRELQDDEDLRQHVVGTVARDGAHRDASPVPRYGRRLGWYAIVRATKPPLVVETGVHNGLGSLVLTSALLRNREEGHPGRYVGTELDRRQGWLLGGAWAEVGGVRFGDSLETLRAMNEPIGVFINDSVHEAGYEAAEYQAIEPLLTPDAVILSDDAHNTRALLDHADQTGRRFLYFHERPEDHWYPGAGIGAAYGPPSDRQAADA